MLFIRSTISHLGNHRFVFILRTLCNLQLTMFSLLLWMLGNLRARFAIPVLKLYKLRVYTSLFLISSFYFLGYFFLSLVLLQFFISIFHIMKIFENYLYSFITLVGVSGSSTSSLPLGLFPHFDRAPPPVAS